jgi:hypothetical protein
VAAASSATKFNLELFLDLENILLILVRQLSGGLGQFTEVAQ